MTNNPQITTLTVPQSKLQYKDLVPGDFFAWTSTISNGLVTRGNLRQRITYGYIEFATGYQYGNTVDPAEPVVRVNIVNMTVEIER
jgi:hypothetical protein